MTTEAKADCGGGYGKPPGGKRFQKGRSGNPRGRPRAAASVMAQIIKALDKRVPVSEGGRTRKISKRALGLARLADQFAAGDPSAMKLLFAALLDAERRQAAEPVARPPFDEHDREVIKNLRELFAT